MLGMGDTHVVTEDRGPLQSCYHFQPTVFSLFLGSSLRTSPVNFGIRYLRSSILPHLPPGVVPMTHVLVFLISKAL